VDGFVEEPALQIGWVSSRISLLARIALSRLDGKPNSCFDVPTVDRRPGFVTFGTFAFIEFPFDTTRYR
jgi:hypothetical protein